MAQFKKQPAEKFDISVDFGAVLDEGETIDAGTSGVTAIDMADNTDASATVLEGGDTIVTSTMIHKVKGGANGSKYKITFTAGTSNGNIYEKDIVMEVWEI